VVDESLADPISDEFRVEVNELFRFEHFDLEFNLIANSTQLAASAARSIKAVRQANPSAGEFLVGGGRYFFEVYSALGPSEGVAGTRELDGEAAAIANHCFRRDGIE
jgi:hypothetical protein